MCIGFILLLLNTMYASSLPTTQTGLIVVSGVPSCGQGRGYCLLGNNCTVNEDLQPDIEGHCNGLRNSRQYPSKAYFSCCRYVSKNAVSEVNYVGTAVLNNPDIEVLDAINILSTVDDIVTSKPTVAENSALEMTGVATAVLSSTDTEVPDSVDVLNRAQDSTARPINFDDKENKIPASEPTNADTTTAGADVNEQKQSAKDVISSRSMNFDDAVEQDVAGGAQEFYQMNRAIFGDYTKNEPNCTRHEFASLFPLSANSVPVEQRGAANKEKFDKNKCLNLTNQFDTSQNDEGCINIWKFVSQNELLCFGTLISSVWLLTSAACITRMFQDGIDSIIATDVEEKNGYYGISNVIVHENYMADGISDMHDIGLVSLNQIVNGSCFGCLPIEERKYADKSCVTYPLDNSPERRELLGRCQDRLKILNMNSKMYLSLPCLTEEQHPLTTENHAANALWCDNKLVGIETSYDQGLFIFTPINDYVDWITQNVQLYL